MVQYLYHQLELDKLVSCETLSFDVWEGFICFCKDFFMHGFKLSLWIFQIMRYYDYYFHLNLIWKNGLLFQMYI